MDHKVTPRFTLDFGTGIPIYRQIMNQINAGKASGALRPGDQLPTVRQMAVDLGVNPNTIVRAYRELEIRGVVTTQQGIGTFLAAGTSELEEDGRDQRLTRLAEACLARAGADGFGVAELLERMHQLADEPRRTS